MPCFMVWSPMANQCRRDELRGGSGKAIHGSGYREGAIRVQDLLVLCGHPFNCSVASDVGDQDGFVVKQVLA